MRSTDTAPLSANNFIHYFSDASFAFIQHYDDHLANIFTSFDTRRRQYNTVSVAIRHSYRER